jgi:inorganic pyrophosphatase
MKQTLLFSMLLLAGCKTDYENLPAFSDTKQLQAVIEIPAGNAHKYEYNPDTREFQVDKEAGRDRIISFLPYPVNYGFIPSTLMDKSRGGDGDPLDVLVLGESRETGTVMEILPIGVLLLEDAGELDYKVLAVPAKPSERLIEATSYEELNTKYPAIKKILEEWFLNYNPKDRCRIMGWKDERFAEEQVRKWMK